MDANELSDSIQKHLAKIKGGTPLDPTVEEGKRARIKRRAGLKVLPPPAAGASEKYAEIDKNLFFFYHPATVVRWPKPVEGELQNFTVRIEPVPPDPLPAATMMTQDDVTGNESQAFKGRFRIESDGTLVTLVINPDPESPNKGIDVVVLGNPGGEMGTNGPC